MTTASLGARVVEKVIAKLKTVSDITKYVGSGSAARIYGSHMATVRNAAFPAISIMIASGTKAVDQGGMVDVVLQIDIWMEGIGNQPRTWDDVMECYEAMVGELHRNGGWDNTIGVKVFAMQQTLEGPQMFEGDTGVLHYPSRWRVRASL